MCGAFCDCYTVETITINDSVTSIDESVFRGCSSLKQLTLPFLGAGKDGDSASEKGLLGYLFSTKKYLSGVPIKQYWNSKDYFTYYIPISLKETTITGGNIQFGAFQNCTNITNINLTGNQTKTIGSYAFRNCTSLTSISLPENISAIKNAAFSKCEAITNVYIKNIDKWAQTSFTDYYSNPLYYADNLYIDNVLSESIVLSSESTFINSYAFYNFDSLRSIVIPNSVTSIGIKAFTGCDSLNSISFETPSTWHLTSSKNNWMKKVEGTDVTLYNDEASTSYLISNVFYLYR